MTKAIFSPGIFSKEGNDYLKHGRSRKEKRLDKAHVYEQYETKTPKQRASEWFKRPAYSIRGDTIGQAKTSEVQNK